MSDATNPAVVQDAQLVERLRKDATACAGCDECQVPLMYCAFGPADHCAEYAALWLRILAERDALLDALRWCSGSADFAPGGQAREGWQRMVAPLLDNAERVIRG